MRFKTPEAPLVAAELPLPQIPLIGISAIERESGSCSFEQHLGTKRTASGIKENLKSQAGFCPPDAAQT